MNAFNRNRRPLAALVLATIAAASFTPAAYADRGHGKVRGNWGPTPVVVQRAWYPTSTRYVVHRSSGAPVLAGLLGGLILGAAIANAAPPPPPPCPYVYVDPYCGSRWATFDDCAAHLSYHAGPRLVQVVDVRSGACSQHVVLAPRRLGGMERLSVNSGVSGRRRGASLAGQRVHQTGGVQRRRPFFSHRARARLSVLRRCSCRPGRAT
jgi:hypothetical protein